MEVLTACPDVDCASVGLCSQSSGIRSSNAKVCVTCCVALGCGMEMVHEDLSSQNHHRNLPLTDASAEDCSVCTHSGGERGVPQDVYGVHVTREGVWREMAREKRGKE